MMIVVYEFLQECAVAVSWVKEITNEVPESWV
jgi:hypothetical protein